MQRLRLLTDSLGVLSKVYNRKEYKSGYKVPSWFFSSTKATKRHIFLCRGLDFVSAFLCVMCELLPAPVAAVLSCRMKAFRFRHFNTRPGHKAAMKGEGRRRGSEETRGGEGKM